MHRWGSPDYAREFIRNMSHEHIRGFYMGSDGYFWGPEFIAKDPELAGRLEIDKHWYNFSLFGKLAYNNDLDDDYWKAVLKHFFPSADVDLLFTAWETVSERLCHSSTGPRGPQPTAISLRKCARATPS